MKKISLIGLITIASFMLGQAQPPNEAADAAPMPEDRDWLAST